MIWATMAELLHLREYFTETSLNCDPQGLCCRLSSKWNHFMKTAFESLEFCCIV